MTDLCDRAAVDLRRLIGTKQISPVDLVESCIQRTEAVDGAVNAIVTRCFDQARAEAKAAEQAVMDGDDLGLLHGLPVGVKDMDDTAGVRTTFGSLLYKDNVPEKDQLVVANIKAEGGIVLGKTNTPEFGAGANTVNRVFGATGNPFDPTLSAAGSSGGSGAALAAGMVPLATGGDYGGSLRNPAAFCGVVGFRPSPGVVPNETKANALTPFSQLGPMGRSVADAALLLRAQMDADARDPFGLDLDEALLDVPEPADLSTIRIALSEDLGCCEIDEDIRRLFQEKTARLAGLFADVTDTHPDFENVHDIFEITRGVNYSAAHQVRLRDHRDLLGPNVIDNTERGLQFTAADIGWAFAAHSKLYKDFVNFFDDVGVLISPAASVSPFPHAQLSVKEINGKEMPTYMRWLAPVYAITMGLGCGIVIPFGVDHKGLPMGLQISSKNGNDALVLEVALALEDWCRGQEGLSRPVPDLSKLTGGAA